MASVLSGAIPARPTVFLWRYVRARPWSFGTLAAVIVAAGSCAVTVQYGMKLIVDAMASADRQAAAVWTPLTFFLGLIAVESVLWRCGGWLGCRAIVSACADMRVDLFAHLSNHPMRYFHQHHSGALGNRISTTAASAGAIFGALTWSIVPPCVDFIGAIVVLTLVDWHMAVALLAFVVVVAVVIVGFGVRGRRLHQAYGEQSARVGGEIVDAISNIWAVQAFSAQQRERARLERELGLEARAQRKSWMYVEKARVIHDVFLWVMAGSMLAWALWSWRRGAASPGDVVVVSALTFRILHGSRDLALALVGTAQHFGVIAEMLSVVAPPHGAPDLPHARPLAVRAGSIELRHVRYRYPDGHLALDGLNLMVAAGQKVGIVGASGAGKSTLLSVLQRADVLEEGCILIDGQPIRDVTHDSLRAAVAVVPQDISLFRRTVMENIRYGRPDASDAEVERAARLAHCDEFIEGLSQGYQTMVGERGAALSGGQRQRIGIARAFLKDAPILLLDEATSALDSHSEELVKQALVQLMRHRTVLAAAHRLSTLSQYDRIVVLSEGRIVEDGPLPSLLQSGGMFRRLWDLQAGQAIGLAQAAG
ncbi:ABC transporter ATP-binding protein [Bordetella genomosp. 13]|uniref:ABC transporter ATP-binding protein n=1 Tax=Bordetella genomosp. 13 TaxID=463040 RepID=UPI0011A37A6B|nr:ABC transporter ATP-binding protein [Bordetella genomosp. 13]